jgi:hypothetical protein
MNTTDLLQSTGQEIIDIISSKTSPSVDDLTIDAASFSGLNAALNTNGLYYYQVRARELGGEMQVQITDREGSALAESLSPYNCTAVVVQIAGRKNYNTQPPSIGFNADVQTDYSVNANGTTAITDGTYILSVITLEIKKLQSSTGETILGEVFYSVPEYIHETDTPDVIVTMINPIPK